MLVVLLGWLTKSSILPKKHRAIEGVGASSILELKAHLYKSQKEAKVSKQSFDVNYHRAKKKIIPSDASSAKNSGFESRAIKYKLELKAIKDGSARYAALEKKAKLYDKLVRGELSDEEDKVKYCVDFFRKGIESEELLLPQRRDDNYASVASQEEDGSGNGDLSMPFSTILVGPERTADAMDKDEHKHFVREVHEEANQAREKVLEPKVH